MIKMKQKLYILLIIFMVCYVPARADMWKSHKWLNRATSTGKSWNYTGTRLNGITHGGGIYETNPYQRVNHQEDNGMMSRKMSYDMTAGNAMNEQNRKTNRYNVSFSGESVRKSNFHIVSGKVAEGNAKSNRAFFGGASMVKEYRYGRRNIKYNEIVNSDVNVSVKYQAGSEVTGNEVRDCGRMKSAARDGLGNSKGPKASPFGDLPELKTFDRNGGLGPAAKPIFDGPLTDGLIPLLLMAGLFAAWKKKLL